MSKRKRMSDDLEETWRREDPANFSQSLDTLMEEVSEIKLEIGKFRELAFRFINAFEKAFQCSSCKGIHVATPIIACSSCATQVGCETCVDEWYKNSFERGCPKCRTSRGLSKTFILKGFDELVGQIKLLSGNHDDGAYTDTVLIEDDERNI